MAQESTTYYNLISDISSLLKRSVNSAFIIYAAEIVGEVNMAHRAKLISDAEAKYLKTLLQNKLAL